MSQLGSLFMIETGNYDIETGNYDMITLIRHKRSVIYILKLTFYRTNFTKFIKLYNSELQLDFLLKEHRFCLFKIVPLYSHVYK